jgi:peptide-methionine (S)-S-oxide reductase
MRFHIALASVALLAGCTEAASQQKSPAGAQAVFATGCFWCTESDFDKLPGVISTTSGYTGGKLDNPTYEQVSAGGTGHIEAVRVVYDPKRVSYAALAAHAFRTSDPLDAGGQFCDRGYHYRAALFPANPAERQAAEAAKARAAAILKKPVATLILPAARFYPAEGLPPGLLQEEPDPLPLLPLELWARCARGRGVGQGEGVIVSHLPERSRTG